MSQTLNMQLNGDIDLNSRTSIVSANIIAGVVPIVLLVAPALVDALMSKYHYTGPQAGSVITNELGGMALAAIPGLFWVNKPIWRIMALLGMLAMAVIYFISAFALSVDTLPLLRLASGIAGGTAMCVILAQFSQSKNPDANFGWWVVSQLLIGAIGLAVIPRLMAGYGLQGYYIFMGVVSLLMVIPALQLAKGSPNVVNADNPVPRLPLKTWGLAALTFAGLVAFCIGINGTWIFMGQIGAGVGLTEINVGDTLSMASLFGIAGAFSAAILAGRLGRMIPVLFGLGTLILALILLMVGKGVAPYAIAAFIFKYSWTFTLPFLLSCLSSIDATGKLLVIANFMIGAGMSVGPMISGNLLAGGATYLTLVNTGITAMVAAIILVMPILLRNRKGS